MQSGTHCPEIQTSSELKKFSWEIQSVLQLIRLQLPRTNELRSLGSQAEVVEPAYRAHGELASTRTRPNCKLDFGGAGFRLSLLQNRFRQFELEPNPGSLRPESIASDRGYEELTITLLYIIGKYNSDRDELDRPTRPLSQSL